MSSPDDYTGLITPWHSTRPNFVATVSATIAPTSDLINTVSGLPADFDIDTAIGPQLDVVGQWVGRTRYLPYPIANLWFTFGDPSRGWGKGIWKGNVNPGMGIRTLDDATFRALLKAKVIANAWDGSLDVAAHAMDTLFATTGALSVVQDNYDMTMIFGVAGERPDMLRLALWGGGYVGLKPQAVSVRYIVSSVPRTPLFGFGIENEYIAGWGSGSWGASPDQLANLAA